MTIEGRRTPKYLTFSVRGNELYVADMVELFLDLAKVYDQDRIGNADVGSGLRVVARALRPYSDCLVEDLPGAMRRQLQSSHTTKTGSGQPKLSLPEELEQASQEGVEEILSNDRYTKGQIAELGDRRFGMSRAKLVRLRKSDAREAVRAALEHERSLDAIGMEARRGSEAEKERPCEGIEEL